MISKERRIRLKLRITIEGKTYEAEVEILEDEDQPANYAPYPYMPATYPAPMPSPVIPHPDTNEDGGRICRSPVTGMVIKVNVESGQTVQPSDVLMVLEAMKMETQVTAHHAGTIKSVNAISGNSVKVHQVLIEFE